jgi:hypothetical protein
MTKKQILILTLAFLLGLGLSKLVTAQSRITGPEQAQAGTLVTFEIIPSQEADWTITSVETTECVFQTDTSTQRLYFATPQQGTYHVVAAIIVDDKPVVLTKTFTNGSGGDIKPLPPVPTPLPPTPLAEWVKTQLPLLVKSKNVVAEQQLVAQCFEQTVQKIDNGTIKIAQNARSQLQIALTMTLAFSSDTAIDDWQPFLTALSQQMAKELANKVNDIDAVKTVLKTVADALATKPEAISAKPETVNEKFKPRTSSPLVIDCLECQPQPTLRTYRLLDRKSVV